MTACCYLCWPYFPGYRGIYYNSNLNTADIGLPLYIRGTTVNTVPCSWYFAAGIQHVRNPRQLYPRLDVERVVRLNLSTQLRSDYQFVLWRLWRHTSSHRSIGFVARDYRRRQHSFERGRESEHRQVQTATRQQQPLTTRNRIDPHRRPDTWRRNRAIWYTGVLSVRRR